MTWEHIRSHHQYTEIRPGRMGTFDVRAKSATTGRWVKVRQQYLREIHTPIEVQEAEEYVRREHLQHLAWQLSRELPFNLGTAVTNIALSEHGGSLLVAAAALRDEMDRTHQSAEVQPPIEENNA